MFDSINYSDSAQPAVSTSPAQDRLFMWYVREYFEAVDAQARASVCRAAQHDGYTGAQFSAAVAQKAA